MLTWLYLVDIDFTQKLIVSWWISILYFFCIIVLRLYGNLILAKDAKYKN